MAENTGQVDPNVGTIDAGDKGQSAPVALIDAEGNFSEKWYDSELLEEGVRGDASLVTVKNLNNFCKSHIHQRKMVGQDQIAIPGTHSTPDDWTAFHKAGGMPDSAEEYGFTRPEEMPEEMYDADFAKSAAEKIHELGGNTKLAQGMFQFWNEYVAGLHKTQAQDAQAEAEQRKHDFYSKYGNQAEEKLHIGNIALERASGDDEEFKNRMIEKYGDDPDFNQLLINFGDKFVEHKLIDFKTTTQSVDDIQTEIDEIRANPAFVDEMNPAYKAMQAKMTSLYLRRSKAKAAG